MPRQIENNAEYGRARNELFEIYLVRPDLQKAFPLNGGASYTPLLEWAATAAPDLLPAVGPPGRTLSSIHGPWRGLCHDPVYQRYRRLIANGAMRSNLVVVSTPSLAFSDGVVEV